MIELVLFAAGLVAFIALTCWLGRGRETSGKAGNSANIPGI